MSIAPPPIYPAWPPPQYPTPPARRRWPAIAAAAAAAAIIAGTITTVITWTLTEPDTSPLASAPTVTVTAAAPEPLPAEQADAQTCHAWGTADTMYSAAAQAQSIIPKGYTITSPEVQTHPTWKAGVLKAADIYGNAATTFEAQIAPGTSDTLASVAATTVGSLRVLSEAYKSFDPTNGYSVELYNANQKAMDWLCQ